MRAFFCSRWGCGVTGLPSASEVSGLDLAPYAGRWVALVRGRVAGVGSTARAAWLAAKRCRPKEEPMVFFVPLEVEPPLDAVPLSPPSVED